MTQATYNARLKHLIENDPEKLKPIEEGENFEIQSATGSVIPGHLETQSNISLQSKPKSKNMMQRRVSNKSEMHVTANQLQDNSSDLGLDEKMMD